MQNPFNRDVDFTLFELIMLVLVICALLFIVGPVISEHLIVKN